MNKYFLLSSTFMLLTYGMANASMDNFEGINLGTHTHLPQIQLNSPSLKTTGTYKTAAICALGSAGCGMETGFNQSDSGTNSSSQKCKDEGYISSPACDAPKVKGAVCPYHSGYAKPCICPPAVTLGNNEICSQKCNGSCITQTICPDGTVPNLEKTDCINDTPPAGTYFTPCTSCEVQTSWGTTASGKNYYGCRAKTCSDNGLSSYIPTNNKCSSTSYCGNTCYSGCYQPACSEGGYADTAAAGQICSTINYYGRTCYSDCHSSCPSNLKITLKIDKGCPAGLTLKGTANVYSCETGKYSVENISCTEYCYERYNETENIWKEGTPITLTNLSDKFTYVKSHSSGTVLPVSNKIVYITMNSMELVKKNPGINGLYDEWIFHCD